MSRFLSERLDGLQAYVPGEQPKDTQYIKLNTNENPYPPSKGVLDSVNRREAEKLYLYSDPTNSALAKAFAKVYAVNPACVLFGNGSDEILSFCFQAFCDAKKGIAFPQISYGFYAVLCGLYGIPFEKIPLKADFTIDAADYCGLDQNIVIANPNAPTGLCLSADEIVKILETNRDNVVIIDEAYVDFGGESVYPLIDRYDNLIVVQTFSKSRSLAGGRLGFAIACESLIADLNKIKYSTNPYNVNRLTTAAGVACFADNDYYLANCRTIMQTREDTKARLRALSFTVLDSSANFLFVKSSHMKGKALYLALKQKGILVRHFDQPEITDYLRVTIGTPKEMEAFLKAVKEIEDENQQH